MDLNLYYTKYDTDYCTCKATFKNMMTKEAAEELGKEYCKENGYEYLGTFLEYENDEDEYSL